MKAILSVFVALALIAQAEAAPAKKGTRQSTAPEASGDYSSTSYGSSRHSSNGLGGKVELEPAFGFAFIGPTDINGLIHDQNEAIQKAGFKSYNADDIGSSTYFGLAATYRVIPSVGLGLGFAHLGGSSEGTAKVNEQTINTKYEVGASFLTAESRITVFGSRREKLEGLLNPFLGIGFYKGNSSMGGTATNGSTEVNSSAKGFVAGTTASLRYWFIPSLAGGLTAGYRFAKSGVLKVDSQKGTDTGVGTEVDSNGKKIQIDASSFVVGLGLTWAI